VEITDPRLRGILPPTALLSIEWTRSRTNQGFATRSKNLTDSIATLGAASTLTRDLTLPALTDPRRCGLEPALDRLSAGSQLGMIIRLIPHVTPAARNGAGREERGTDQRHPQPSTGRPR
jgi:hypothetical protein